MNDVRHLVCLKVSDRFRQAYPVGFVVDDLIDSAWISDLHRDVVKITIDLGQVYEVSGYFCDLISPHMMTKRTKGDI